MKFKVNRFLLLLPDFAPSGVMIATGSRTSSLLSHFAAADLPLEPIHAVGRRGVSQS
jgi:hypothetical protein